MMHLSHKEFTSASEILANAQAVRQRLMGRPKVVNIAAQPKVVSIEEPTPEEIEFDILMHYKAISIPGMDEDGLTPLWKREPTQFDAHVLENRIRSAAFANV